MFRRLLLVVMLTFTSQASAMLNIEITEGSEGALPIAVVPFAWSGPVPLPQDLGEVIRADLARSGFFAPLSLGQLPSRPSEAKNVDYGLWRAIGTENLVVGRVSLRPGGGYIVQFQLLDVLKGEQLAGYSYSVRADQFRQLAHQISDVIYEKLSGERGAFNTRMAYITVEQLAKDKRRFKLAVADADGFGEETILTSPQPLMSPAWSPDGSRLAYVSFEAGKSAVYVQDIASGKREKVAAFPGINSAPAWSPDAQRLALTLSRDGNPEIYLLTLVTRRTTRVTHGYAIDTEPTWAPDGKSLVFTSDRGGRPQIYQVDIGQDNSVSRPRRLTFEGDYNARPAFSPDGRRLAMVHGRGNRFDIAVMDLASGSVRIVTESRLAESPSFAPNGSMIIYATEVAGRGVLEAVSVEGRGHQRLSLVQGDVREPSWSPYLTN